jgi:hypothetical protein
MGKIHEVKVDALKDLASKIAAKIEYTARTGSLKQARAASKFSTVSVIDTPAYTDKAGKEHMHSVHTEFKAPSGKIISIRSRRDLEALVYLKESPRTLDAFIEVGSAALTLNPEGIADTEPEDEGEYF